MNISMEQNRASLTAAFLARGLLPNILCYISTLFAELASIIAASFVIATSYIVWAAYGHSRTPRRTQEGATVKRDCVPIENSTREDVTSELNSAEIIIPTSVNYHFTRQCNYKCGFCFHTAKTSFILPLEEAKRGLQLLKDAGMEKINFSGGEPFLPDRGRYIGQLVRYCKQELRMPSVTIVSNGSLIRQNWFKTYGEYLDILAISCDSFVAETNTLIGRQQGNRNHLSSMRQVREWCAQYKVAFKINTVVNTHNKMEDMAEDIMQLNPVRWKVFQCLVIDGENAGENKIRDAEGFVVSDDEFQNFLSRHSSVSCLVPESNSTMRYSYLILDEYMRFLDGGTKQPSASILDVGVTKAIGWSQFDEEMFIKRGGKFTWGKAHMGIDW